jgi:hypothetical protein
MGKERLRCGTSVGANYRAACRARSRAEFVSRLGIVVEEADESMFWLELPADSGVVRSDSKGCTQKPANLRLGVPRHNLQRAAAIDLVGAGAITIYQLEITNH